VSTFCGYWVAAPPDGGGSNDQRDVAHQQPCRDQGFHFDLSGSHRFL